MSRITDIKRREIQLIKIAQKQLGMDETTYRAMLFKVARVKSSTQLDAAGRKAVLDHLKSCGFKVMPKPNEWAFIDNAVKNRQPLLRKVCMVCKSLRVGKAYAEGAAKRQSGVERKLEMMDTVQLLLLVGALEHTRKNKESRNG